MHKFDYLFNKYQSEKNFSKSKLLKLISSLDLKFDDLEHLQYLINNVTVIEKAKKVSPFKKPYNVSFQSDRQKYVLKINGNYIGIYKTKDDAESKAKDLLK
jgi:hypothetical protein